MKSIVLHKDVENKMILEQSPIDKIAKVIDFYFPYLLTNLLSVIESVGVEHLKEKYDITTVKELTSENWQQHLPELFWNIAAKENVYDYLFFNDYYLYINFFLQYPRITGKEIDKGLNCEKILHIYENMELEGMVYRFIEEVEYIFIANENFKKSDELSCSDMKLYEEDEMLYEIMHIDEIMHEHKQNNF